ncbi:MAG TPA: hypothetical protein VKR52_08865 [Terracidiphilus sp.]|nr:hypothetical protein [Terracidiphilus sp.]
MSPSAVPPLSSSAYMLALALLMLAPLALAGVALMNTGLGRSRSAAQSLLGSLAVVSVAVIAFAIVGSGFASGSSSHAFQFDGKLWNWLGNGPFLLAGLAQASPHEQLAILFEFLSVSMAVLIAWGSGADRFRLAGGIASAAVLALIIFPAAAHWVWGGGWLAQLGINFSLGAGFADAGGASASHSLGGLSALVVVWLSGPRKAKFPKEEVSTAMPGHSAVFVLFGCFLALVGWLAWNTTGALLWIGAAPSVIPVVAVNTLLSAAAGLAGTFFVTRIRFGKPDASLCANGWLAGLVTSSACAGVANPIESLAAGLVAGIFTPLLVEVLELALSIDDPSGAITVHGAAGLWGLFAAGIFASESGQVLAQLIGIAALLGLFLPVTYLLLSLLNRVVPFRADADGERLGMDLHELGGGAYPEFVIHRDDPYR